MSAADNVVAAIEKSLGRRLTPEERPVVAKAVAPLDRLEERLVGLETARRERIEKRRMTPEFARMVLDLDERISAMEIRKGVRSDGLAVTHPDVYVRLREIAGDPIKKNGANGAAKPHWAEGIL